MRERIARVHEPTPEEELKMRALSDKDALRLMQPFDDRSALPGGAAQFLTGANPRLLALRRAYEAIDFRAREPAQSDPGAVDGFLDLLYFRGDTAITWRERELPRAARLKLFIYLTYIQERDELGLLERLEEDGLFGCWTYDFPGRPTISRELLDSVNELLFLQRHFSLLDRPGLRLLEIGAGYGELAHRMATAATRLADYCCVDGTAEAAFLCEYYLEMRECSPPARVLPLPELDVLATGEFDLAVIRSLSSDTLAAARWWLEQLRRWEVATLFVISRNSAAIRSIESDGSRCDLVPVLSDAGYRRKACEPVIEDAAVREIMRLDDHFHLFELHS